MKRKQNADDQWICVQRVETAEMMRCCRVDPVAADMLCAGLFCWQRCGWMPLPVSFAQKTKELCIPHSEFLCSDGTQQTWLRMIDNAGALQLVNAHKLHPRTKHLLVRLHQIHHSKRNTWKPDGAPEGRCLPHL